MNSIDKEQQRLDAIISKRALGQLQTSISGARTRRWPAAAATSSSPPPPPVPPRSPPTMTAVVAPPLVPARAPAPPTHSTTPATIRSVSLDSKPRLTDEEQQEPDDLYRAKCEAQRLDKYISGEWRLARALRASSGTVKARAASTERSERQHKEAQDVVVAAESSDDSAPPASQVKETTTTSLVNAINELVYLLGTLDNGGLEARGFDAVKALVIVQKAKAINDLVTTSTLTESETCSLADDTAALASSIARFVRGWRDGDGSVASSTALTKSAGSIASHAAKLQRQLRRSVIADA